MMRMLFPGHPTGSDYIKRSKIFETGLAQAKPFSKGGFKVPLY
jgi:hypothetical protein